MNTHRANDISAPKKALFTIVAVALPLLLLILLELALRLFNYGGNLDLFIRQTQGEHTEYVLNKDFTKRYFFQKGIKTPIPLSQTFAAEKDSSTFRIFCLGASTTQGFPYPPNGGYPAILQNLLTDALPKKNIEVINCGITAITSHSVLDMQREIFKHQPDMLIIYSGHNEFYGVFGQASTLSLFQNRTLLKLFLTFQQSRLVLLTRNSLNQLFGQRRQRDPGESSNTLMQIMARDVGLSLDSEIVARTQKHYRQNLMDMCTLAEKHDTKLLLCTLVDNQRDLPPFASAHAADFARRDSAAWKRHMQQAQELQSSARYQEAIVFYAQALAIDSTFAQTHFRLAQCYDAVNDLQRAMHHFQQAKDYDIIRFRAPSAFNSIIKQVANEYDVPIIDIKSAFDAASPAGVAGFNLLHEHVHPNLQGYLLMAKTMAAAVQNTMPPSKAPYFRMQRPDSVYLASTKLTMLDHEVVNYTLFRLTSQWPFPPSDSTRLYHRSGTPRTEELARQFVDRQSTSLVELHLNYGNDFHQNNELDAARREYEAALAIQPLAITYNRLGRVYLRHTEQLLKEQHNYSAAFAGFQKGVFYFKEGLKRWPDDSELNFNLGLLYVMRQDEMPAAIQQFEKVLELQPEHKNAHHQLVQLYIRQKDSAKAKSLLQQAVARFPDEARFYTDLGIIFLQEKNLHQARTWLRKAIQLNNDPKAAYVLKQLDGQLNQQ